MGKPKVAKTPTKTEITMKVDVWPGRPVSLARRNLYKKFWQKIVSQVRDEIKAGENPK